MNVFHWMIWGLLATIVLTICLSVSQGLKLTRMNIPFMLGTFVTSDRDRAKIFGVGFHIVNGFIFSLFYVAGFHAFGQSSWVLGALFGFIHAAFVLAVVLPNLPGIHPRMAKEHAGPTELRLLEPPGFWALNYGFQTPFSVIIAHIIFGIFLGYFYKV